MDQTFYRPAPPIGLRQGPQPWPPRPQNLAGSVDGFFLVWPKYRRMMSGRGVASLCTGIGAAPMALLGTILYLLSFFAGLTFAGSAIALSVGGLIAGIQSRREIKRRPQDFKGGGMALTGVVLNWCSLGLALFSTLIALIV